MESQGPKRSRPGSRPVCAWVVRYAECRAEDTCQPSTTTCYLAADESGTFLVLVCARPVITEIVQKAMDRLTDILTRQHLKPPTVPRNSSSSLPNES